MSGPTQDELRVWDERRMSRTEPPARKQQGVDGYYQRQARDFVDILHESGVLNPSLTREQMDATEDYIAVACQQLVDSAIRMYKLSTSIKLNTSGRAGATPSRSTPPCATTP